MKSLTISPTPPIEGPPNKISEEDDNFGTDKDKKVGELFGTEGSHEPTN
jgi:hypothetical protein